MVLDFTAFPYVFKGKQAFLYKSDVLFLRLVSVIIVLEVVILAG
jgi:hypothetical protein